MPEKVNRGPLEFLALLAKHEPTPIDQKCCDRNAEILKYTKKYTYLLGFIYSNILFSVSKITGSNMIVNVKKVT